ncbi:MULTISPECIES: gluconate 2-dehydrogenase subunit 3 family protein [Sphingobacterium]|uniref:Gluconate 2-dehydrogenase subunit 3 family protein n=1 Tax=Sphingobacterium litopenaei TaxID=2763500 RepID=A0ABR7YD01_9SPHI|nr:MULTISPECIES: gluconate 2-dehydrogenase subunit 3 family protein [Sphingobacterium]MBD1429181.1 gluconate 2-dehydrogenase subunit 3 family protein [Sphingobacterium litopenaei]NGM73192.1 gluconate 2-dehydrogenase subunit 3 family protein [Sphingobacterium sp. SGL-16]
MNRRDSLKALGLIAAGSAAILTTDSCDSPSKNATATTEGDRLPGIQDYEYERTQKLLSEKYFDEHEMATIAVLADLILPKDENSPSATEVGVPDFIEFIVKDIPSHQLPMRGGLKWLDIYAQKKFGNTFIELKVENQTSILDEIAYPSKAKPEVSQGVSFFNLMRDLTSSGYFTTKEGIAYLGYVGNRPGVWNGVPEEVLKAHGFDEV